MPRRVVVIGLILAAVWHIEFLRLPSGADDDIHRYVWDGRLQRLGYNPYLVVPSDPAAKGLHTPETRNLNNPDLPSPYPAGAQLFFRAVTAIHESTFALKVAFVVCDFAIVLVLLDVLRWKRQGAHLVLAYAWNPLLAIEVAGSGHIDIVGALLLLVSAAALGRRWRATAAVALGLAVAVKLLPIVLLPLYWKRVRIRDAALAAAVVGLLYVPFLNHGRIPIGSLGTPVVFAAIYEDDLGHALTAADLVQPGLKVYGAIEAAEIAAEYNPTEYPDTFTEASAVTTDGMIACSNVLERDAMLGGGAPAVYSWEFTDSHAFNVEVVGRFHAIEDGHDANLPFLFQWNPGHAAVHIPPFTVPDRKIAIQMGRYWGNFARTGDPNGAGLPAWPRWVTGTSTPTIELTPGGARAMPEDAYYDEHKCGFWEPLLQGGSL